MLSAIQPDELNQILKLYQSALDDSSFSEDQTFINRFDGYCVSSDSDKRLFVRFLCRICEIFDLYAQKKKIAPSSFLDRMHNLQEQLLNRPLKISAFLTTIFNESRRASGLVEVPKPQLQQNETRMSPSKMAPWYRNTIENKKLYSFYEKKFWKLYEIMQLDRNYIQSLIVPHQTKSQNVERLLKLSLERNEGIDVTRWCSKLDGQSFSLIIENKLSQMCSERRPSGYMMPIIMFPAKRTQPPITSRRGSTSIKISPARRVGPNPSSRQLDVDESTSSPIKLNDSLVKRPAPLLRPISRKQSDEDTSTSLYSPVKIRKQSTANKTFIMYALYSVMVRNFPELSQSQEPRDRQVVIHHKDLRARDTLKRIIKDPPVQASHSSNSNLLFSNTSKHSNGITAILFLERNMRNYLSKFE